jgi:hypothetical protein
MITGFISLFFSQLLFYLMSECEEGTVCYYSILPMVLIGLGNCILQLTLLCAFTYSVQEKYYGTAFGLLVAMQNMGLLVGSFSVGLI